MADKWSLTGTYFEACTCEAACQCVFLSPPDAGECTAFVGFAQGRCRTVRAPRTRHSAIVKRRVAARK